MTSILRRADPRIETLSSIDLRASDDCIRVSVRRVAGAKRFTLRVRSATRDVVLTMPRRASIASAREFAEKHVSWIGARVRRLPQPIRFAAGEVIPLRGIPHSITHRPLQRGTVWIETQNANEWQAYHMLCVAGGEEHITRRIGDYLRREAKSDLAKAVKRHAEKIDVSISRIGVRDTTSRWGSCSSAGVLSFSWRLILAPGFVLDYLAAHEVAHRVHLDHSPKFWALARSLAPETDRAEAWLKAHGSDLHRYGEG